MIEVVSVEKCPTRQSLAKVIIKYYDLTMYCELCMFKDQNLWIRMPEIWRTKTYKQKYVWWGDDKVSSAFQVVVLKKVFDMLDLPLDATMKEVKDFFTIKKELTDQ